MPTSRIVRLLAALLLPCLWVMPAAAQEAVSEAQDLFRRAEEAFADAHYLEAAQLFEAADAKAPHASVVYNAAVSWEQAGERARAADGYMLALGRGGLVEDQAQQAEQRLEALSSQLGFIQISKPVGGLISVAHKSQEPIPARFYLAPGSYRILLETDSGETTQTPISVSAGDTLRVKLVVPDPPPPPAVEVREPVRPPPPREPPPAPESWQRTLGWVGIGVGAVATGVAIYFGTEALAAKDEFESPSKTARYRNLARKDAVDFQTKSNVAWGGAAVFGGAGAVLLFTAPSVQF